MVSLFLFRKEKETNPGREKEKSGIRFAKPQKMIFMDWKEFFRPTKGKIILWIVFFLISPTYLTNVNCIALAGISCPKIIFVPVFGGIATLAAVANLVSIGVGGDFIKFFAQEISISFFILMLLLSCIISCLIVFTYNKFRAKNQ